MNKNTICIGVETPESDWLIEESIHELQELAETAGLNVTSTLTQKKNQAQSTQLHWAWKIK